MSFNSVMKCISPREAQKEEAGHHKVLSGFMTAKARVSQWRNPDPNDSVVCHHMHPISSYANVITPCATICNALRNNSPLPYWLRSMRGNQENYKGCGECGACQVMELVSIKEEIKATKPMDDRRMQFFMTFSLAKPSSWAENQMKKRRRERKKTEKNSSSERARIQAAAAMVVTLITIYQIRLIDYKWIVPSGSGRWCQQLLTER